MTREKRNEVYKTVLKKKGLDNQILMVQEECFELALSISKLNRYNTPETFENFIDELADVTIMMEQMEQIPNFKKLIDKRIEFKINRLKKRLK